MKFSVCAIRDAKSELYSMPMFVGKVGQAIREFTDEVNRQDPKNALYKHPEDYSLWELGSYDDESGVFENLKAVRMLVHGNECRTVVPSALDEMQGVSKF